jgi:broad specificity phosphatase PhoE
VVVRVLVVQHAEKQPFPGDPGLTDHGHVQADRTARWLARESTARSIWSSPMRRARETAEHVAEQLGLVVEFDPRLRERMNWSGAAEPLEEFVREWTLASTDRAYMPSSGDSSEAAAARFLAAIDDLAAVDGATAVVVTHGGVTTDALRTVLGDDELLAQAPGIIDIGIPHCAITTLSWHNSRWSVDSIAVTDHLS